jgi:adenylate cyclase
VTTFFPPHLREWLQPRLYHLFAPLVALALLAAFEQTKPAQSLEYLTVSLRFQARAPFDPPADDRLFLVGIDQQSLDALGRWPWPRAVEGDFLKSIAGTPFIPDVIAFDVLFTEPSSPNPANPEDKNFADAVGLLPSVITGAISVAPFSDNRAMEVEQEKETAVELTQPGLTAPLSHIRGDATKIAGSNIARFPVLPLRQQSFFGFVNDDASAIDDIRHTIPFVLRVGNKVYPSLSLQTLCQLLHVDPDNVEIDIGKSVQLKNDSGKTWTVPIDEAGEVMINYRRESSFRGTSFVNLADRMGRYARDPRKYPLPAESDISHKVLVVAATAVATTDLGPTPLQPHSPLVYTHLNVIDNVLKNDYLRFVPWYWVVLGWSIVTWGTLLRLKEAPLVEAVAAPIGGMILYTIFAFGIFWAWSRQIALTWPLIGYGAVNFGAVILRWREEQRGRQQIKNLFSRMLSPEVLDHLLAHPENLKLGGSDRAVTVLFSDIRDYTKFSEGLPAGELVRQLNIYFERMVDCVKEYRGTFHKYIGDAVMSAWGDIAAASLGPEKDAQNAVRAALKMVRELRELNEERQAEKLVPLRIGIGLNHGDALVGLIGASSRPEFTVMGDAVNIASRLEGLTKTFGADLAIGESLRQFLGDHFLVRRLGLIQLKGKTQSTVVYEVLAEKHHTADSRFAPRAVEHYEEAFDHFLARRFAEAQAGFNAFAKDYPDDYCVKTYLQATGDFITQPPPPEWDGRVIMETK